MVVFRDDAEASVRAATSRVVIPMDDKTFDQSVTSFLDQLASSAPAPGGGGAAALGGAMAAALVSMVCNLTIGKPRFAAVETEMRDVLDRAEALRHELQELAEADVVAFNRLSASYKLPRTTDADVAIRRDAIQSSLRLATEVPLRTARAAAAILPLCPSVAEQGNQTAVSDIGVAVLHAHAAVRAALLNVDINLRVLEDAIYVRQVRAEVERLTDGLDGETQRIVELVRAKINV
jgi:methenyltetrahydrofolate cyclohydrolase